MSHAKTTSLSNTRVTLSLTLLLFLCAVVVYIPALRAGYVWDDAAAIAENPHNKSLHGLVTLWTRPSTIPLKHYWPLTFTFFWLEYQLWGDAPLGYHLMNILLHGLNVILVWLVLRRMFGLGILAAWIAAAFFAVHPVHAETVAWVIERKSLLAIMFYLFSALSYERFVHRGKSGVYILSVLLFACAMLSKTIAVTLPVALLLWHWYRGDRLCKRDLIRLGGFFFVGIVIAAVHVYFFLSSQPESTLPWLDRIIIAGRALWFYIGKLLFPYPLMTIYPRWGIDPAKVVQWLYPTMALAVVACLWALRRKIGRAPFTAAAFFVVSLAPVLNIIDQPYFTSLTFVNDHAVYLASIGFFGGVAALFVKIMQVHPGIRPIIAAALTFILIGFGLLTRVQASLYRDMETLFTDAVEKNPSAAAAHYNLARAFLGRDAIEQALVHYERAVKLNPGDTLSRIGYGSALMRLGDTEGAESQWKAALEIDRRLPRAHANLAGLYITQNKLDLAIDHCRKALDTDVDVPYVHLNLGSALFRKGQVDKAIAHFQHALRINPSLTDAHINLGLVYKEIGKNREAIEHFSKAVKLDPNDLEARLDLISLLKNEGRLQDAADELEQALQRNPDDPVLHYRAGVLFSEMEETVAAVNHLQEAVRLKPDWVEALANLAWIKATSKDDSVRNGTEALEFARRANNLTGEKHPVILDTLAAAYAEVGDFDRACVTARQAISLARDKQPREWVTSVEERLALYRANQPYRE